MLLQKLTDSLKKFFFKSKRVLQGFGENAGVIDLGEAKKSLLKWKVTIIRALSSPIRGRDRRRRYFAGYFYHGREADRSGDYFVLEIRARPHVSAGRRRCARNPGYGNCVGVPTVTGQTEFHSSYDENILVNAFALGIFREGDPIVTSAASGVGNWVVYVGAKTGRDGVHGASMASESFAKDSAAKRPTVQIGDPFFEKLLIESCLEVMKQNLVVAIQDMGAAGLTSSSFEMAAKGDVGVKVHLDQVPLRDPTMTPEEILLSESQERMLLVCEPNNFQNWKRFSRSWGLDAQKIGEVTQGPEVELFWHGEKITSIRPQLLTDEAPLYERPYSVWKSQNHVSQLPVFLRWHFCRN